MTKGASHDIVLPHADELAALWVIYFAFFLKSQGQTRGKYLASTCGMPATVTLVLQTSYGVLRDFRNSAITRFWRTEDCGYRQGLPDSTSGGGSSTELLWATSGSRCRWLETTLLRLADVPLWSSDPSARPVVCMRIAPGSIKICNLISHSVCTTVRNTPNAHTIADRWQDNSLQVFRYNWNSNSNDFLSNRTREVDM